MDVFNNGDRFVSISLWRTRLNTNINQITNLDDNLYITTTIPFEVTEWWKEQIGSIQSDELRESEIFLIAKDHNNSQVYKHLSTKCLYFYYSFLLSGLTSTEAAPKLLTGKKVNGIATF